ncbi:MAG: collagen-like protein, partial [Nitrosopumilus sp.]
MENTETNVSSQSRITIKGQAPFKQSGVYEAQIIISDSKPSEDAIKTKQFASLWKGNFHLRVNNGIFSETIGSADNPLPSSIGQLDGIWIIVVDLFSSLHSVFHVPLANPSRSKKSETISDTAKSKPLIKEIPNVSAPTPTTQTSSNVSSISNTTGISGPPGDKG